MNQKEQILESITQYIVDNPDEVAGILFQVAYSNGHESEVNTLCSLIEELSINYTPLDYASLDESAFNDIQNSKEEFL